MGTMEKAGIAVVGVLIAVIVAVGIMNRKDEPKSNLDEGSAPVDRGQVDNVDDNKARVGGGTGSGVGDGAGTTAQISGDHRVPDNADGGKKEVAPATPENGGSGKVADDGKIVNDAKSQPTAGGFPKTYTIKPNDLLTKIAYREYGTTAMAKVIAEHNKLDPTNLKRGSEIELPEMPESMKPAAEESPALGSTENVGGAATPLVPGNSKKAAPVAKKNSKAATTAKNAGKVTRRPSFITASYLNRSLSRNVTPAGAKPAATKPSAKAAGKTTKKR